MSNAPESRPFRTAVVIGASIAGSSTAAALAPYFDSVVVIDRDRLPDTPAKRRGVPHSGQFHTLTAGGRLNMEELFPGLTADLREAGVPYVDYDRIRYSSKFGWFPPGATDMKLLMVTRRYLEWYLRDRAGKIENLTFKERTPARGVVFEDKKAVAVQVEDLETAKPYEIRADLIVDASGRPSVTPEWLDSSGFDKPEETVVDAHWGYATTFVRVPEDWDPGWTSLYVGPTIKGDGARATRGAAMWRQEDNMMVVTAQGCAGDLPPSEEDDFMDYISSFGNSEFKDLIEKYGRATKVEAWQNTHNRLRHYSDLANRPENLVVLGDAAAAFNPIYGQGMTVAVRGALTLRDALDSHVSRAHQEGADPLDLDGFAKEFQDDLQRVVDPCWAFSTTSDFNVPGVAVNGEEIGIKDSPESDYTDRVIALATEDAEVRKKFLETINLVRSTDWLGEESLRERVLADWDRLGALGSRQYR